MWKQPELALTLNYYEDFQYFLGSPNFFDDSDASQALFISQPFPGTTSPTSTNASFYLTTTELPPTLCSVRRLKPLFITSGDPASLNSTNATVYASTRFAPLSAFQILVMGLNAATTYTARMVTTTGTGTSGESLFLASTSFVTKSLGSLCRLPPPVKFCSIPYAIPVPPGANIVDYAKNLDGVAQAVYTNFTSLFSQFNCGFLYSPVKTCDDCRSVYKVWTCAVYVPKCGDLQSSSGLPSRQFRIDGGSSQAFSSSSTSKSASQSSASSFFTSPFIPPCIDICHAVIRACPSGIYNFKCPALNSLEIGNDYAPDQLYPGGCNGMGQKIPAFLLSSGGCQERKYWKVVGILGVLLGVGWW